MSTKRGGPDPLGPPPGSAPAGIAQRLFVEPTAPDRTRLKVNVTLGKNLGQAAIHLHYNNDSSFGF